MQSKVWDYTYTGMCVDIVPNTGTVLRQAALAAIPGVWPNLSLLG